MAYPLTFPKIQFEDGNGAPDLGDTWSIVDIGRIRICGGAECNPAVSPNNVVDRYVAIFTGGMDSTGAIMIGHLAKLVLYRFFDIRHNYCSLL